jgi:hypothetical protein
MAGTDDQRRQDLNALPSMRLGREPDDESHHFMICPECGQAFDMRKLGDVFHHDEPGHKPLPTDG